MSHRKQSKRNKLNEFIKNIFSIKSTYDKSHKIFTLLGIKLKVKNMSYKHAMYRKFLILHEILKYIGYIKYRKEIYKNKKARICVCLHLYYMNSWEKIKKYLKNLSPYKYDLYVSCCKGNYNQKTLNKIKKFKKDVKITIFPNIGYDVGSFIETINNIDLNNYDIVFKIHSKGVKRPYIYIYNQIFKYADWFHNLYEGILGEFTVHETIDKLMNNKNIGLIASENLIVSDPIHKQNFTKNIAKNFNINVPDNYKFVAGTCFAAKSDFLQPVQNYKLNIHNFNEAQRGVFSLAHAMERIICINKNYSLYGININYPKYKKERKKREKYSSIRLLYDKRFDIDFEFFYKVLELQKIINYEIIEMKLKDIKRDWHGFIYSLYDVSPYKYLISGSSDLYNQYAFINKIESGFDMSEEKYKNLINNITQNNFNPKKLPIINSDNIILDGQHRCCILMHQYGGEHTIPVLKIDYTSF